LEARPTQVAKSRPLIVDEQSWLPQSHVLRIRVDMDRLREKRSVMRGEPQSGDSGATDNANVTTPPDAATIQGPPERPHQQAIKRTGLRGGGEPKAESRDIAIAQGSGVKEG
jgi:hypothetical protein